MRYVAHRRFKCEGLCGKVLNIPYGTKLKADENGMLQAKTGDTICHVNSERGRMYFAADEDGKGLERGKYTYAIAYSNKHMGPDGGYRFTEKQRSIIVRHYQRFIEEHEFIIFNSRFFKASIAELKAMAKELEIKV